jgi:putative ABC transport system substrate-binding protein
VGFLLSGNACLAERRLGLAAVGELWSASADTAESYRRILHEQLAALGWVEGRNVTFVPRFSDGGAANPARLVDELVSQRVDVLFVSAKAASAAHQATSAIPIVCAAMVDPVAEGLASSLARPGGNITGLSWQSVETAGKRLGLAREVLPHLKRIAILFDATDHGAQLETDALRRGAERIGIKVELLGAKDASELAAALTKLRRTRAEALFVPLSPLTALNADQILERSMSDRVPVIGEGAYFAQSGALLAYGPNATQAIRRAAEYIDKLLRGARPGDLPIEQPLRFDLILNLATAKTLGLAISESMRMRADAFVNERRSQVRMATRGVERDQQEVERESLNWLEDSCDGRRSEDAFDCVGQLPLTDPAAIR